MSGVSRALLSAEVRRRTPVWAVWLGRWLVRYRWLVLVFGTLADALFCWAELPGDTIAFAEAGRLIVTGHWGSVFADDFMQAGPWQLLWDLVLTPTHHPGNLMGRAPATGALPAFLLWDSVVVFGGVLVGRALRVATGRGASAQAELAAGLLAFGLVVPGPLWAAHTSQVATPALWMAACCFAWRDRPVLAGVLLGISVGWEPWGVLAMPVLLATPRLRGVVSGGLAAGAVTAATYGPFIATGHFAMFEHVWPISPQTFVHMIRPDLVGFTWPMRALQASAVVLGCAVVVLRTRRGPDVVWLGPLAATLVRLLLDPTMFPYYWVAVSTIGVLAVGVLSWRAPLRRWVALALPVYTSFVLVGQVVLIELCVGLAAVAYAVLSEQGDAWTGRTALGRAARSTSSDEDPLALASL